MLSGKVCAVPGCKESGGMHNVLHGFPHPERDRERFNIWLHAVGGDILKLDNDYVYRHRRVCRSHFEQKYLRYNNLLSSNAVPTLGLTCSASKSSVKRQASPTLTAIHTGPPAKHPRRSVDQQRRASSTSTLTETDIFQDPDVCLEEECATIAKEEVEESIVPIIKPFTWQKRTEAIHVKADNIGDIADNLSMYSGDEERTSPPRDIKNDTMLHEGFVCNTCQREIRGFRYTCVQCSDLDLCSACELDRAHHHHYVLRVPEPRPYAEIQLVLATIRNHLLKKLDPITQFEQYDDDAVSVKSEIKSENEDDGLKEPVPVRDDTPTHRQRQHYVEGDSAIDTNNLEMTEGTQRKTRVEKINDTHSTKATSLGVALQHKSQPASVAVQQKQQPVSVVVQHSHGPASITVQHKPQLASVAVQHKPQLASVAVQHKPLTASVAVQHNPQPASVAVQQKQQPVSVAVQQKQQPISVALQHNQAPLSAAVPHIQQPLSVAVQHQQQPLSVDVQHKQHPLSIAVQHIQQPLSIAVPHIQQPLSVALQNQQQPVSVAVQHNQQPFSVPVQQLQPVSLYVQHQQQPLSFYIQHQQQPFSVAVQPQQQPISVAIPQQQPASVAVKHEIKPDIDDVQYKHQSDTDAVKHQQQSDSDAVQLQQQSDGDAVQHEQQSDTDAVQHQKQPVNIPTDTGTHIVAKNNLKINFNDFLRVKDSAMEAKKIQVLPFPKSESKSLTQKLLTHKAQLRPGGKLILMKLPSGMLLKDGREGLSSARRRNTAHPN